MISIAFHGIFISCYGKTQKGRDEMEIKKIDLGKVAVGAGQNTKAFLGKAKDTIINAIDQNGDGTLDRKDVSALAQAVGNAANAAKSNAEAKNREKELQALQPIFPADLTSAEFTLSKLIRVSEMDKRHAESEVCKGSIGFVTVQKGLRIIHIYKDAVETFGLTLFPGADSEIYYVDPSDRDKYIALDHYFDYLKIARVNELQKIAQDLGAKHFRVTYKEKSETVAKCEMKGKVGGKLAAGKADVDGTHNVSASDNANIQVAAELQCLGHAPIAPKLYYLRGEPSIQSLIALRMDENSPIFHQDFSLQLSNSSGICENDACKIDAALKAMKLAGSATMVSEVKKESRRSFEYEVDF